MAMRSAYLFTEVQVNQLLEVLESAEQEGIYWGNKAQFWKRHRDIKTILQNQKIAVCVYE